MSEAGTKVTENGRAIDTPVTLFVNKKIYEGWEDVKITRELNAAASDFQLQMVDKWEVNKEPWRIQPGDHVHIHAGGKSILTGYSDSLDASISESDRKLAVTGRSKTGDLVDCSAAIASYEGLTLSEIAKKLCAPFGISVSFLGEAGASVKTKTITPGETVFTVLEYLARQRKLLIYPGVEGNLIFSPVGARKASGELRQGANILTGAVRFNNANRFSQYEVKGQGNFNFGTEIQVTQPSGLARDSGITRYRPMILNAENTIDDEGGDNRAAYEADLRAAQALEVDIQVYGWFQPDGNLWDVNQLVSVDAGFLGVRRKMLIKKVEYNKNASGTITTLTLCRSDAFGFKKIVKQEDKLGWVKAL